jgi:hypothetical protein
MKLPDRLWVTLKDWLNYRVSFPLFDEVKTWCDENTPGYCYDGDATHEKRNLVWWSFAPTIEFASEEHEKLFVETWIDSGREPIFTGYQVTADDFPEMAFPKKPLSDPQ